MIRVALAAVLLAVAGCGDASRASPATETVTGRGVRAEIPFGWQPARAPITSLSDPREEIAVGTYELRRRPGNCEAFAGTAQQDIGSDGMLVLLLESAPYAPESGPRQFEPRPAHFGPSTGDSNPDTNCSGGRADLQWIPFRDGGRYFFAMIALGKSASAERRKQAYAVLDSLVVDPAVRPDWEGSP